MRNFLAGCTPFYLRELCVAVSSIPGLRSNNTSHGREKEYPWPEPPVPHKSFSVVSPSFWNRVLSKLHEELLGLSFPPAFPQVLE